MSAVFVVLLLAPWAVLVVVLAVVIGAARGARPQNTPAATLVAARRHENRTSALALAGGLVVAVLLLMADGAALPGPPGGLTAVSLLGAALVALLVHAVGELTWPRPVGAVRRASLRRRTMRDIGGRRAVLLGGTAALMALAIAIFGLTADATGRAVPHPVTPVAGGGYVTGASGPYPGWAYGLPLLAALAVVLVVCAGVLRLVVRRPAVAGTREEDDLALRRTSARRILGAVQLFVGGTLAAVLLVAAAALGNAGWTPAAWGVGGLGMLVGIASLVVAGTALVPPPGPAPAPMPAGSPA
ncbi:hypothetical protein [Georgenia thermotolerans]|uniref:Uncharacterized protein n=1 Tax=Georgenia thermotolerans TaxID=527326 RepID=A0A7J5USZ1_9MICO|nr:hypothetical protein [Georgenia thermotolerans]KAE8765407.1 hypothetical protein GB883_03810 [Georgenia thermotolerans]